MNLWLLFNNIIEKLNYQERKNYQYKEKGKIRLTNERIYICYKFRK